MHAQCPSWPEGSAPKTPHLSIRSGWSTLRKPYYHSFVCFLGGWMFTVFSLQVSQWGHDFRPEYRKVRWALCIILRSCGLLSLHNSVVYCTGTISHRADYGCHCHSNATGIGTHYLLLSLSVVWNRTTYSTTYVHTYTQCIYLFLLSLCWKCSLLFRSLIAQLFRLATKLLHVWG